MKIPSSLNGINQQRVGNKVFFDTDRDVVEGPTHRAESEIRQTVEIHRANNPHVES